MALVVNTNVPSIASQRFLMESRKEMETAMERLSSGERINSAADDAAGLAISTRMDTQIQGLNMAIRNANDGISLTESAEGAMQEVTDMLQRMRELALQAVHGVNNDDDRGALDAEVQQLKSEIDRVADTTTFNNQQILNGTFNKLFQIGYNSSETLGISVGDVSTAALGILASETTPAEVENTLVSSRYTATTFSASTSWQDGDILINDQSIGAFDGTNTDGSIPGDMYDLIASINENVDNVQASGFNTVVAKAVGDGIVEDNTVAIKVAAVGTSTDDWYQPAREVVLGRSTSLQELVDNVNSAFLNDEVTASINTDGKLVLSNDTGALISVLDKSGTTGGYDGATGFEVDTSVSLSAGGAASYTTEKYGFLKIASTDESPIEITNGNLGLEAPGSMTDILNLGFMKISEDPTSSSYTVTGENLVSGGTLADELGRSSITGVADLTINGVEIYDAALSAASGTFQGKLDMINAFSDETGVVASAYYEKVFDLSNTTFISNNTVDINGIEVDYGDDIDAFAGNINDEKALTGITAEVNGNNLILKGDGVQNVQLQNNTYELSDSTVQPGARRYSGANIIDSQSLAQTATFSSTDVEAGRTFTLTLTTATTGLDGRGGSGLADLAVASVAAYDSSNDVLSYSYTVAEGESAGDVAEAFHDLLVLDLAQVGRFSAGGVSIASLIKFSVDSSVSRLEFVGGSAGFGAGSASITIGVTQVAAANLAFSAAHGTVDSSYGAIRLQSIDATPISIEFGEAADSDEIGFREMNVGDTTWDVNAPTFSGQAGQDVTVSGLSVATSDAAQSAIDTLDAALDKVSDYRSNLGAIQNRLNHTVSNLSNVVENTSAAKSRIADADFAVEAANLAKAQILQQAGTAMLAQANAAGQSVLSLLG